MKIQYRDQRGWKYKVMGGLGESTYKGRFNKPGKTGWHGLTRLPWRNTEEEAQADLDAYALKKGWIKEEIENE
ncbi:MAG: hypothetical protein RR091_12575 [Cloacibacillus sp.]